MDTIVVTADAGFNVIKTLIVLIWLHLFADFFLQTDKMATSKSGSAKWLSIHVSVYTVPFLVLLGWQFALLNAALHWATDFFSSRATSYLWKKNERHWFFAVIGIDQAVHMTCLVLTIPFINSPFAFINNWLSV